MTHQPQHDEQPAEPAAPDVAELVLTRPAPRIRLCSPDWEPDVVVPWADGYYTWKCRCGASSEKGALQWKGPNAENRARNAFLAHKYKLDFLPAEPVLSFDPPPRRYSPTLLFGIVAAVVADVWMAMFLLLDVPWTSLLFPMAVSIATWSVFCQRRSHGGKLDTALAKMEGDLAEIEASIERARTSHAALTNKAIHATVNARLSVQLTKNSLRRP
jgi:hypothetical protein